MSPQNRENNCVCVCVSITALKAIIIIYNMNNVIRTNSGPQLGTLFRYVLRQLTKTAVVKRQLISLFKIGF